MLQGFWLFFLQRPSTRRVFISLDKARRSPSGSRRAFASVLGLRRLGTIHLPQAAGRHRLGGPCSIVLVRQPFGRGAGRVCGAAPCWLGADAHRSSPSIRSKQTPRLLAGLLSVAGRGRRRYAVAALFPRSWRWALLGGLAFKRQDAWPPWSVDPALLAGLAVRRQRSTGRRRLGWTATGGVSPLRPSVSLVLGGGGSTSTPKHLPAPMLAAATDNSMLELIPSSITGLERLCAPAANAGRRRRRRRHVAAERSRFRALRFPCRSAPLRLGRSRPWRRNSPGPLPPRRARPRVLSDWARRPARIGGALLERLGRSPTAHSSSAPPAASSTAYYLSALAPPFGRALGRYRRLSKLWRRGFDTPGTRSRPHCLVGRGYIGRRPSLGLGPRPGSAFPVVGPGGERRRRHGPRQAAARLDRRPSRSWYCRRMWALSAVFRDRANPDAAFNRACRAGSASTTARGPLLSAQLPAG